MQPYSVYRDSGVERLGEVPGHWDVRRLKFVASTNDDALSDREDPLRPVSYVDISSVDSTRGITHVEEMVFEDAPSRARRLVRDGDTIVSTVRTYLRAIAPISDPPPTMVVSTGFAVIRPRDLDPGFSAWALRAHGFVEEVVARSVGVSYPAINAPEIGNIPIAVPPLEEQREIAGFLDRETGRIDLLIAKERLLIERLREYRTALITRAVTRGLPSEAARLKPSGVEWLGNVPWHWDVRRLGLALAQVVGGGTPDTSRDDYWSDYEKDGVAWVAIADMSEGGTVYGTNKRVTTAGMEVARLRTLPVGTIIYSMYASVGAVARLGIPAVTNQAILGLIPAEPLTSAFLYWWLHAIRRPVLSLTRDNTQSNLNAETVQGFPLCIPPFDEQRAIVSFLDQESKKIDELVGRTNTAIERLEEYRSALITSAVTGKIDVREGASAATGLGGSRL